MMNRTLAAALTLLVACGSAQHVPASAPVQNAEVVHVAPPTGERDTDRASILAALEQVEPGGTIQFAPGTYLLGGFIPVSVSGVTLLGHRNGTTLRGCDPAERSGPDSRTRCNTLALVGSRQEVRNLTFEYMSWGLTVGMVPRGSREFVYHPGEGGHLIEGNTFRDSFNGVRVFGDWPESVVVRGNSFVNTYHAGDIFGRRVQFLDNDISAPDPSRLATFRHVGGATQIAPLDPAPGDVGLAAAVDCEENVIAGNRYDGHPDAIVMYIVREGSCRNNVIRDNTIIVRRAGFFDDQVRGLRIRHETDSTLVGIPLVLADWGEEHSTGSRGVIENNVIEGNRIIGAEGLGIMLHRASRNRVAANTITGIRRREPFPGNVLWGIDEEQWRHANGSAIWVSPGSEGNQIRRNTFEDIAASAVFLEGDSNQVILQDASDSVRDLARGNVVSRPAAPDVPDTVHVASPSGERQADRASILTALKQVHPGAVVQFAAGTYLIGEFIQVPVSGITLVGHPRGTTLRGCDPEEWSSVQNPRVSCNTLELLGSHQVVRDFTFEHMSLGLALGPGTRFLAGLRLGDEEAIINSITGGHRVEGNTFRESSNGIRGHGRWSDPIVIRGNRFINMYHAVGFGGSRVYLLDNDFSVPDPERVPGGHPGLAVQIAGTNEHFPSGPFPCEHNVVAGNRIEGHPQGSLYVYALGARCRYNVIRDNTIIAPPIETSGEPPAETGVPLLLYVAPVGHRGVPGPDDKGSIAENVIEGNRLLGAEGLGIAIYGASRNRIANNTISGITRQNRNLLETEKISGEQWREANGSAIWVSPGSDHNEIVGDTFEDIASHAVVLEGDSNHVELRSGADAVRDLGIGNRVTAPGTHVPFMEEPGRFLVALLEHLLPVTDGAAEFDRRP